MSAVFFIYELWSQLQVRRNSLSLEPKNRENVTLVSWTATPAVWLPNTSTGWAGVLIQQFFSYWLYHLPSLSYLKPGPLTGVWNPDLTRNQELNNLLVHDSNFVSSLQILEITDLLLTTRSRQFTINGAKLQ